MENINTIVNFSNSVLKHFGVSTWHDTISQIDKVLANHKKVVVVLFDGMGQSLIKKHLKDNSFIRKNYIHTMNATFPPTTVASTTGLLSGRYPIENGWMAWRQFFPEYQCNIKVFNNIDSRTNTKIVGENILTSMCPYKTIFEQIEANGHTKTDCIMPFPISNDGPLFLFQYSKRINQFLKQNDDAFIYVYFTNPDGCIHANGVDSTKVKKVIRRFDRWTKKITRKHKDTLFLTIADHGLVDCDYFNVREHQDFYDTFIRFPSFEGRSTTFFVKEDKKEQFVQLFKKYYGNDFKLMSKQEVLDINLYGEGTPNPHAVSFLGDYLAISIGKWGFDLEEVKSDHVLKAHHAGFTKEEMLIDISAFNCKNA